MKPLYPLNLNAYGCEQVAVGGTVCTPAGLINRSALVLSETEHWNALRASALPAASC